MIVAPAERDGQGRGRARPEHQTVPARQGARTIYTGKIVLKVGDNITTDHILPAGGSSSLTARTFRIPRISALSTLIRSSRLAAGSTAGASSSAAQTMVRALPASTRRSCRCIWASRRSSPRRSRASTAQIWSTRAFCRWSLRTRRITTHRPAGRYLPAERARGSEKRRAGDRRLRRQNVQGGLRGFRPPARRASSRAARSTTPSRTPSNFTTIQAREDRTCPL